MGATTLIRRELLGLAMLLAVRRRSHRHHCLSGIVTLNVLDSTFTNGLNQRLHLRTMPAEIPDHPIRCIGELLRWNLALPNAGPILSGRLDTLIRCPPRRWWAPVGHSWIRSRGKLRTLTDDPEDVADRRGERRVGLSGSLL
jgi:hypothetical protein